MSDHGTPSAPGPDRPGGPGIPASLSTFPPDPPDAGGTPGADRPQDARHAAAHTAGTDRATAASRAARSDAARLHTRVVLPLILVLGFMVRTVAALRTTVMMNDAPDFLWQAQRLLEGDVASALSHPYHPLYATLVAGLSWLVPGVGLESVGLWVSMAGGLLTVPAAFFAVRRLLPERPELASGTALVAAVTTRFVEMSSDIQSDGLFTGLVALACWALVRGIQRDGAFRSLLGAGLLVGLAFLTRPEALFLLAAVVPWLFGLPTGRARGWVGGTLGLVLGTALVVVPYSLVVRQTTGEWGVTAKPALAAVGLTGVEVHTMTLPADAPLGWPRVNRIRTPAEPDPKDEKGLWIFWDNGPPPPTTTESSPAQPPAADPPAADPPAADPPAADPPAADPPAADPTAADPTVEEASAGGAAATGPPPGTPPPAGATPTDAGTSTTTEPAAAGSAIDTSPPPPRRASWGHRNAVRKTLDSTARLLRWDGALLLLVGLFVLLRRRTSWALSMLLLATGFVALLGLHVEYSGYLSKRHFVIPLVLLLPFLGAGAARLLSMGRGPRAFVPRLLGVLAILALMDAGVHHRREDERLMLDAMTWVHARTDDGERVAVDRRRDAWIARRPGLVLAFPCHDPELLDKLERHDVRLLVLRQDELDRWKPHWTGPDSPFVERARFGGVDLAPTVRDAFPDLLDEPDVVVLERRP